MKLKDLLEEGLVAPIVLDVSRSLLNVVKKKGKKYKTYFDYPTNNDVEATFKIIYDKTMEFAVSFEAWALDDSIGGEITINPEFLPMAYNEVLAEFKETIRHELEHVAQSVKVPGKVKMKFTKASDKHFYKYLLLPHEIAGFLHGFNTRAKTERKTIDDVIDQALDNYDPLFTNKNQKSKVRAAWLEAGKKLLPHSRWKK